MPKWGLAMKEGSVIKWLKEVGDEIKKGEPFVEIETEKVVNEFDSPEEGILIKKCADVDEKIPVGSLLALFSNTKEVSENSIEKYINNFQENFKNTPETDSDETLSSKKININGYEINYLQLGNSNSKNILLIHGFGGDLNNWMFNQEELSKDFNVFSLDLPGHGLSSKNFEEITISNLSETIVEFCKSNNIEKVNLIGHSLGGGIALKCAIDYSDLVESLTLISPIGLGKEIESSYLEGFISADSRRELKTELEKLYFDSSIITRDLVNEVLKIKRIDGSTNSLELIKNEIVNNGNQKNNFIKDINSLTMAVLVIWGNEDKIIPKEHTNNIYQKISVKIIEECGHMAHIEKARDVNQLIKENLN